jgi:WD40 repeat protein
MRLLHTAGSRLGRNRVDLSAMWDAPLAPGNCALHVQDVIPPHVMLPSSRLQALVSQAVQAQLQSIAARDNDPHARVSLFSDYSGSLGSLPTECLQVHTHQWQVWNVQFSPDGTMLATGCRGGRLGLWKVRSFCI